MIEYENIDKEISDLYLRLAKKINKEADKISTITLNDGKIND